ncbi:uncharacterized protein LOC131595320 [Vicia villosa]|uniref:uncharacterized protein LOC131595320 n=1 Tax=Vicia villosa TaxID=3911 RepID=UPI00273C75F1|nr:uncharacterized protein LOC131595320 [Vicia villosa]
MSILANDSPTKDFVVSRGLRQGDPLSPFPFALAAEGLTAIMRQAVGLGLFREFSMGNNANYSLLQFADDTIIVGEASWANLWTLKSILHGFEMVSGLSINMAKSKVYGVGIEGQFLNAASHFLCCKVDKIPFKFLGIVVGGNHRRLDFWKPVVKGVKDKLSAWKGRFLSMGGRKTLINAVLANIPVYYLSFFKVPVKIVHELTSIQRNFLWNGSTEKGGNFL